jgi:hypothetical protein
MEEPLPVAKSQRKRKAHANSRGNKLHLPRQQRQVQKRPKVSTSFHSLKQLLSPEDLEKLKRWNILN